YTPTVSIDRSPELVAPAAGWLAHEDCPVSGRFYAATAGGMRRIFTAVAAGYQSAAPDGLRIEEIHDQRDAIRAREPSIVPETVGDMNAFRNELYRSRVTTG